MATDYDRISREYQLSKLQPWRQFAEAYTFFNLVGDLSGKKVLDLACGDGFYTRQLKLRGAAAVVGVDISKGMIDLARASEAEHPLDITYHVQNVLDLDLNEQFELITASYLLNYASNIAELTAFAKVIATHLKPGARFVTINSNPDYESPVETIRKYGFTRENESRNEGSKITYRLYQEDGSHIELINFHLEKSTHEHCLESTGLSNLKWHPLELDPSIVNESSQEFWKALIESQPVIGLTCQSNPIS